jgi:hypothetical protein
MPTTRFRRRRFRRRHAGEINYRILTPQKKDSEFRIPLSEFRKNRGVKIR